MKLIFLILLLAGGSLKAQINSPAPTLSGLPLFFSPDMDSRFDSLAINRYVLDGKPALTLSRKGESLNCVCLSNDTTGTLLTALLWRKESPLACPWPYTRLDTNKPVK